MFECAERRYATLPAESFPRNALLLVGFRSTQRFNSRKRVVCKRQFPEGLLYI